MDRMYHITAEAFLDWSVWGLGHEKISRSLGQEGNETGVNRDFSFFFFVYLFLCYEWLP